MRRRKLGDAKNDGVGSIFDEHFCFPGISAVSTISGFVSLK